jgi:RNA polymerase sigma factor (sigma-70 family)
MGEEAVLGQTGEGPKHLKQRVLGLLEANKAKLARVAERCGVRRDDTDDFLQDLAVWVLEELVEARTRQTHLEAWFVVVAENRAYHAKRKYSTGERRIVSGCLVGEDYEETRCPRAVDQSIMVEEAAILDRAISSLPAQQQEVVGWRLRGFSFAEIAGTLEIAEATARHYHMLAVRGLRELLVR